MLETVGDTEFKFPMRVGAFLKQADKHLRRGDILLSRSPTPASRMIRILSGSAFSHAAMVFLVPQKQEGFESTFVIESLFRGVGIASLDAYVSGRHAIEEVAVMRLEGKNFTESFFKLTRGLLLNELNKPYDYHRLFLIGLNVLFGLHLAARRVRRKVAVVKRWMPRQFICSGFIQYGLYQAAEQKGLDTATVILKNGQIDPTADEMLAVTPEDLLTSEKLTCRFVIRRGWVYSVENPEEIKLLISGAKQ
jgi:hypothetical protein